MPTFRDPMINLYSRDLSQAAAFYSELGFVETFRTPASGEPVHMELTKDGFTLGIATLEAAKQQHNLRPGGEGHWIEIVLWTDDTDAAVNAIVARGAPLLSPAHDFLDGKLRSAWVADPDGNPIQLVQRRHRNTPARFAAILGRPGKAVGLRLLCDQSHGQLWQVCPRKPGDCEPYGQRSLTTTPTRIRAGLLTN